MSAQQLPRRLVDLQGVRLDLEVELVQRPQRGADLPLDVGDLFAESVNLAPISSPKV